MNRSEPLDMATTINMAAFRTGATETHAVAVVGFSQTERIVLGSIFGLSARRNPSFVAYTPKPDRVPDLFLIDADDPRCPDYIRAVTAKSKAPIILVGGSDHGTRHFVLPRPLRHGAALAMFAQAIREKFRPPVAGPLPGPAAKPAAPASPATARPPAKPEAPRPAADPNADRVLVVDDSLAVRKFMEAKLSPYAFQVDFAESGEQAIGFTGERSYTCVFLDVILPGVDGYQVCKLIKGKKSSGKATAVVMLTSKSSPFDKIRGTMAGCDAYLTKPVDEDRLLEVISKFIPASTPEAVAL
ncbi:MAG: response regulator [Burkholderiales bacterium]|nr:response regulator [Burkholderiales bacterium]MCW5603775.1 response regulator [Burkholderiales bacterium]